MSVSSASVTRGKIYVLMAITALILGEAYISFLKYSPAKFTGMAIQSAIVLGLAVALWMGYSWARWLIIVFSLATLLSNLPNAIKFRFPLLIGVSAQQFLIFVLLAFPPSVTAFLKNKRGTSA